MSITWSRDLAVGNDDIDSQHRELFEHLGALLDASLSGEAMETLEKTIAFVEDYIISHFATEEGYMKRYDYPNYVVHKSAHDQFIQHFKVLEFFKQ